MGSSLLLLVRRYLPTSRDQGSTFLFAPQKMTELFSPIQCSQTWAKNKQTEIAYSFPIHLGKAIQIEFNCNAHEYKSLSVDYILSFNT